jgi:hypothetical protein
MDLPTLATSFESSAKTPFDIVERVDRENNGTRVDDSRDASERNKSGSLGVPDKITDSLNEDNTDDGPFL